MQIVYVGTLILQMLLLGIDEALIHPKRFKRRFPPLERWGHPADLLTVVVATGLLLLGVPIEVYAAVAIFSCLFVAKDEWVHARECDGFEQWIHALSFQLHPVGFYCLWHLDREVVKWFFVAYLLCFGVFVYRSVFTHRVRN